MCEEELEQLAEKIADKIEEKCGACHLTPEEQEHVRDLIRTKKKAVKATLWVIGALVLWILKDAYLYIIEHLTFK
ncbi:MAG: hypothetical protein HZB84_04560 [Deltaproteobacteria bacterium]|nr:hypothetical protein [Deltaproteobacteria bacterium]